MFICGNGGSGANASHLCEDLAKCTLRDFEHQKRLKVLSLTDNTSAIMAWGNDEGYDRIFVEQLKNLASPGDVLLAISGSGNSPNILKAVDWANKQGMVTVGITGFSGGKLKTLAQHSLHAAVDDMGLAESLHSVVLPLDHRRHVSPHLRAGRRPGERCRRRRRSLIPAMSQPPLLLGIEIGGTKLQLGVGHGDGSILAFERRTIAPALGARGILAQIPEALDALVAGFGTSRAEIAGVGIGFGGPGRSPARDGAHVASGLRLGRVSPGRLGHRAGFPGRGSRSRTTPTPPGWGEARFGAGRGLSPILYVTIGSGIGGGLIVDGQIYRGSGVGALEIGHLWVIDRTSSDQEVVTLEGVASGWAIARAARTFAEATRPRRVARPLARTPTRGRSRGTDQPRRRGRGGPPRRPGSDFHPWQGDRGHGLRASIRPSPLLAPHRIILGGGVSLIGEEQWFGPIREQLDLHVFPPFRGTFDIVPATLGETVVVQGALALARDACAADPARLSQSQPTRR